MTLHDARGHALSAASPEDVAGYERALTLFNTYSGDPLGTIDAVLARSPDFAAGHLLRAGLMLSAMEHGAHAELKRSVAAAQTCAAHATEGERSLTAALQHWAEGRWHTASAQLGRHLVDHPRDLLAVQVAHLSDFYLGQSGWLRDRIARALPQWTAADPGYGYLLGMYAFGLEECQEYDRAESTARQALEHDRRDAWAVHAMAHVCEMQGRLDDGIRWLEQRQPDWATDNLFAVHNWWHLTLYNLDRGDTARVLQLYDEPIRGSRSEVVLDMIDASAMLWRLMLRDLDVGTRWAELAGCWRKLVGDRYYAFNDAHAMMAFVGARDTASQQALMHELMVAARAEDANAAMAREVGLPVCAGLQAFGEQRYTACIESLLPVLSIAHRFGGSHAQRDLLQLTVLEAALRGGDRALAQALAGERLARKPSSPGNRALARRAHLEGVAAR